MEAYQERVIEEKNQLDEKIGKLMDFIEGRDFSRKITLAEQKRMRRQEMIMELYSEVLADRIKHFTMISH